MLNWAFACIQNRPEGSSVTCLILLNGPISVSSSREGQVSAVAVGSFSISGGDVCEESEPRGDSTADDGGYK